MIPYTFAMRRRMMAQAGGAASAVASLTPTPGVTYTEGIADLDAATISTIGSLISNNSEITSSTESVYVDLGDLHRKISVANQITIPLNGTNYIFDVIGFNHDTLTDGKAYETETATGMAGMTLQMHDLFATNYQMNNSRTNSGGWKSAAMRTSTMATMKSYLPSAWQSIIKPVNKASGIGGGSLSGTETVSDNCFLVSEFETFGIVYTSVSGEGSQYAYYKSGNSKGKYKGGTSYTWFMRSPCAGGSVDFSAIYGAGEAGSAYANSSLGVSFAFCI